MCPEKQTYLDFIAYLQIIGIILVVFGHSFHQYPDSENGATLGVYRYMYSFRMPLFLFVSGFLMVFTTQIRQSSPTPARFALNKIKRLLLPMMVLTVVTFVPRSFMSFAADDTVALNFSNFLYAFADSGFMPIPFFWFIHVSFILLCTCFALIYIFKRIGVPAVWTMTAIFAVLLIYALSSVPTTTLFSLHQLKRLGFFFALGGIYGLTFRRIDAFVPWDRPWFFVTMLIVSVMTFICLDGTQWMYVCSLTGIIMCVSLSKILEKYGITFLDHLKGANYMIFLLSWYGNVTTQQVLAHFVSLPWWVHTCLSLVAGIYIPWLAYKYLERHQDSRWVRVTSFLLGQKFRQPKESVNSD